MNRLQSRGDNSYKDFTDYRMTYEENVELSAFFWLQAPVPDGSLHVLSVGLGSERVEVSGEEK